MSLSPQTLHPAATLTMYSLYVTFATIIAPDCHSSNALAMSLSPQTLHPAATLTMYSLCHFHNNHFTRLPLEQCTRYVTFAANVSTMFPSRLQGIWPWGSRSSGRNGTAPRTAALLIGPYRWSFLKTWRGKTWRNDRASPPCRPYSTREQLRYTSSLSRRATSMGTSTN